MAKSIKVKSLADKYSGATSTGVVEVLQELGINNVPISGTVPAEETKRVEAHLAKIFGPPKSRSKKETKAAPKEAERAKVKKTEPKSDKKIVEKATKTEAVVAKPKVTKSSSPVSKPIHKPVVKQAPPAVTDIDDEEIPVIPAKIAKPLLEKKFEKIPRHNKPVQGKPFAREKSNEKIIEKPSRKSQKGSHTQEQQPVAAKSTTSSELVLNAPVTVKSFAEATDKKPNAVITDLIGIGVFASINQLIPENAINTLCDKYGLKVKIEHRSKVERTGSAPPKTAKFIDRPEDIKPRPPVVTFLGHVDHGKTSLQDKVRNTQVVDGESGHITQHIGASQVNFRDSLITFIDTPGHEAFTQMRARGANLTDIAILVVAADDGFMTQTVEALNHAKAAEVPIIVAINKIDLPAANPDKILLQMQQNNLTSEEWGGEVGVVKVSAKTGEGIPELLERILLESEMLELRANPKRPAEATVLEAQVEHGLGATASVLVSNGTLSVGDAIVCGEYYGRVKTLINAQNQSIKSAGPSTPVKLIGLSGAPDAGAMLEIKKNEKEARLEAGDYAEIKRQEQLAQAVPESMEDMMTKLDSESKKTLNMIIKSDVRGTAEAIEESLAKIDSDKISVSIISSGVGAITENDIMLATASKAMVVGFHVRVNPGVNAMAKKNGVEIRLYTIIYELLEDITDALTGRLQPDKREKELGQAKILQIFALTKGPKICGCKVEKGLVKVGSKARVFRDGELIFNGDVASLRRFQDDVREVRAGFECGIRLNNFADFVEGDVIELYEIELTKAKL